jgi:hypothetical protein
MYTCVNSIDFASVCSIFFYWILELVRHFGIFIEEPELLYKTEKWSVMYMCDW